jgi:hypothetical protein
MTGVQDTAPGDALAAAATDLIGTRFRLHGRKPETGLDCVGVVSASLIATGHPAIAPDGYGLRNTGVDQWLGCAARSQLVPSPGPIMAGDVLLIALGHCQHHLAIAADATSVVHAHAGLRQVVRQPLEADWQIVAKWRIDPTTKG